MRKCLKSKRVSYLAQFLHSVWIFKCWSQLNFNSLKYFKCCAETNLIVKNI